MDKVLNQILGLADKGTVEQRCASLLVLGALKLQSSEITNTVGEMLAHANPVLKDYALRYFEQVQAKAGTPRFLKLLDDPDRDVQERLLREPLHDQHHCAGRHQEQHDAQDPQTLVDHRGVVRAEACVR